MNKVPLIAILIGLFLIILPLGAAYGFYSGKLVVVSPEYIQDAENLTKAKAQQNELGAKIRSLEQQINDTQSTPLESNTQLEASLQSQIDALNKQMKALGAEVYDAKTKYHDYLAIATVIARGEEAINLYAKNYPEIRSSDLGQKTAAAKAVYDQKSAKLNELGSKVKELETQLDETKNVEKQRAARAQKVSDLTTQKEAASRQAKEMDASIKKLEENLSKHTHWSQVIQQFLRGEGH